MKTIIEDCKRVEIEDDGKKLSKTITIIRRGNTNIKIEISNARLKGEWIIADKVLDYYHECPLCHWRNEVSAHLENFCQNCGADMRQEESQNDK